MQTPNVSIPFKREGVSELERGDASTLDPAGFLFPSNGTAFLNEANSIPKISNLFQFLFPSNGTAFLNEAAIHTGNRAYDARFLFPSNGTAFLNWWISKI